MVPFKRVDSVPPDDRGDARKIMFRYFREYHTVDDATTTISYTNYLIIWGTEQKSLKSPRRVFVLPFIEPVNILPNQTLLDTVPPDRSVWMFGKF